MPDNLGHVPVGPEHPVLLANHAPGHRQHGRAHHRDPQDILIPHHVRVQQLIVQQQRQRERHGRERADDVAHELGNHRHHRRRKLRHVVVRTLVRSRQPLLREVAQLVKLPQLPPRVRAPLALAHHAGVPVKPLRVVHDKVHGQKYRDERRQHQVHHREVPHA